MTESASKQRIRQREPLKAPFPYFGGKRAVASLAWSRLGPVRNYVEPFCGSAAMLLARPDRPQIETINDADCYVANFWRATQYAPEAVVDACDWPVNEADLHARHRYLVLSDDAAAFRERMKTDPTYFDARIAGWWAWGACCWIGGGWCRPTDVNSQRPDVGDGALRGVHRKMPEIAQRMVGRGVHSGKLKQCMPDTSAASLGKGVHKQAQSVGMHAKRPQLQQGGTGRGVHTGRPQLADQYSRGRGVHGNDHASACDQRRDWLLNWFGQLRDRLRSVRVCCGDWSRVCGSRSVTTRIGLTGVFLDPPYSKESGRDMELYATESADVAHDVRAWCLEHGDNPQMRIALCGLAGEHDELEAQGWDMVVWKAHGGYGNRNSANTNKHRERIWFSPHCLGYERQDVLF